MTTNKISYSTQLYIDPIANDNTVTKILAIDGSNNIKYRNLSTINGSNQTLNTTSDVIFNTVTTNMITSSSTNNYLQIPQSNTAYYFASSTTANASATTIFTLATTNNTNYLIYAEVSSKDSISGGGSYLQTKMISNTANVINNVNQLENLSNKSATINTSSITITNSGTNIILQVTGVGGRTINWSAFIRVISVAFV